MRIKDKIKQWSETHKDVTFLITNKTNINADNVFYTGDVIGDVGGCDLNEIGYISSVCDVIVGRSSGPFTFAQNKITLDDSSKTFVSFTDKKNESVITFLGKATKIWSNDYSHQNVFQTVSDTIKTKVLTTHDII